MLKICRIALVFLMGLTNPALVGAQAQTVRIILVGDSTVAPKNGWGPGFCNEMMPGTRCLNMAKNGRSTSSYRAEGSWHEVIDELHHNNDFTSTWVFVQFGHNDQPGKPGRSTDLATEFPTNMRRYVREIRETGAHAVLMTPLTRRSFKNGQLKNDLEPWARATLQVAAEEHVPVLDLNAESSAAVQRMGPVEANQLAMAEPPPAVKQAALLGNSITAPSEPPTTFDYTHLGERGSVFFGRMVADEVSKTIPELRPFIKTRPGKSNP